MPPKRAPTPEPMAGQPPLKRRNTSTFTTASASATVSTPTKRRVSHTFPYTPSSPASPYTYHLHPQDSPSNPFGRKRTISLMNQLPGETRFSQHIALRFQFFRKGDRPTRNTEGAYRIVQVPKSYTMLHLRYLIAFLFGGGKGKRGQYALDVEQPAHMFELKKKVELHADNYRIGVIKKGDTFVRLSNVQNPYTYKEDWVDLDDSSDGEDSTAGPSSRTPTDAEADWTWVAEEDMTVGNVWEELDITRAIVFHQLSGTTKVPPAQVHITVNRRRTEKRIGRGNTPYVFEAQGRVQLIPTSRALIRHSELSDDSDADGETDLDEVGKEDPNVELSTSLWNEPKDAFAKYLKLNSVLPFTEMLNDETQRNATNDIDWLSSSPRTPGLTSSWSSASSQDLSSPAPFSFHNSTCSPAVRVASSPSSSRPSSSKAPKFTPAPLPGQRKRLEYVRARLERSKHRMSEKRKAKAEAKAKAKAKKGKVNKDDMSSEEDDTVGSGVDDSPSKGKKKRPVIDSSPFL